MTGAGAASVPGLRPPSRVATIGSRSTVTASPATSIYFFVWLIWPLEIATDVTATMIGRPVDP